nr:2-oxoacid dehydrogenases acyltransferase family protein [Tanacetum cinerariifolium]
MSQRYSNSDSDSDDSSDKEELAKHAPKKAAPKEVKVAPTSKSAVGPKVCISSVNGSQVIGVCWRSLLQLTVDDTFISSDASETSLGSETSDSDDEKSEFKKTKKGGGLYIHVVRSLAKQHGIDLD